MATDTIIAMDSASVVATGPAAARDRAQKTLRQARAACRLTRLPAWAAAAAAALPAVVDGDATCAASPRRPAPVDQESWSVFVRHLGIHIQGLLGVRELILLAITNRSLKHMLSDELDSKCSVWNRCCANETSFNTARIMSAAVKNGKNRYLSCMLQDPHCQLVLQRQTPAGKVRALHDACNGCGCGTHAHRDAQSVVVLEQLLQEGIDINVVDRKGRSALYFACARGDGAAAKILLSKGADVDAAFRIARSCIMYVSSSSCMYPPPHMTHMYPPP